MEWSGIGFGGGLFGFVRGDLFVDFLEVLVWETGVLVLGCDWVCLDTCSLVDVIGAWV